MTPPIGADVNINEGASQYVQTTLQTATDTSGNSPDFLRELWTRPDFKDMALTVVGIFPTSSGGSWSSVANITTANPGQPFPAGGLYINLFSPQDVRNFRIQATAGGTVTFVATAYR